MELFDDYQQDSWIAPPVTTFDSVFLESDDANETVTDSEFGASESEITIESDGSLGLPPEINSEETDEVYATTSLETEPTITDLTIIEGQINVLIEFCWFFAIWIICKFLWFLFDKIFFF